MAARKPRVFSANDFEVFVQHYRGDMTMTEAAAAVGFSPQTVFRAVRDDPEWKAQILEARELKKQRKGERAETIIWEVADDRMHKDRLRAAERLAETFNDDFKKAQRVEITGDGGGPVRIESKEVSLSAIVAFAAEHGILTELGLDRPGEALPAAREILPAPPE